MGLARLDSNQTNQRMFGYNLGKSYLKVRFLSLGMHKGKESKPTAAHKIYVNLLKKGKSALWVFANNTEHACVSIKGSIFAVN
jgi:hypothetical protein